MGVGLRWLVGVACLGVASGCALTHHTIDARYQPEAGASPSGDRMRVVWEPLVWEPTLDDRSETRTP